MISGLSRAGPGGGPGCRGVCQHGRIAGSGSVGCSSCRT